MNYYSILGVDKKATGKVVFVNGARPKKCAIKFDVLDFLILTIFNKIFFNGPKVKTLDKAIIIFFDLEFVI